MNSAHLAILLVSLFIATMALIASIVAMNMKLEDAEALALWLAFAAVAIATAVITYSIIIIALST